MECKYYDRELFKNYHLELIDTLWNVNYDSFRHHPTSTAELIDTLWNVNTTSDIPCASESKN